MTQKPELSAGKESPHTSVPTNFRFIPTSKAVPGPHVLETFFCAQVAVLGVQHSCVPISRGT